MKTALSIILIVAALGLAGCASNSSFVGVKKNINYGTEEHRPYLYGRWYGEQVTANGKTFEWLIERSERGTYQVSFRITDKLGGVEQSQEYGIWGLSGDIYFTKTLGWIEEGQKIPAPQGSSFFDDAYRVSLLNEKEFSYVSVANGDYCKAKKVGNEFELK